MYTREGGSEKGEEAEEGERERKQGNIIMWREEERKRDCLHLSL